MRNLVSILILLCLLSACQAKSTGIPSNLESISKKSAENLLVSIEAEDYQAFQKDLASTMLDNISESFFEELRDLLLNDYGIHDSLTYIETIFENDYYVSLFEISYSKQDLTLRLVLETNAPYQIAGIWFPDIDN